MRVLYLLLFFTANITYAQLSDNFTDGDLTDNPTWNGAVTDFIVNEDLQLQLDAPDEGNSFLHTPITLGDSVEWELFFSMDFNPSNDNMLRIYLAVDNIDLAIAKGYYLEIGENLSNDAIKLYVQDGSDRTLLGSGTMSAVATAPARARIRIKKSGDGTWTLKADYSGQEILVDDLMVIDNEIDISGDQFFGIACNYSVSRADKFFFDDIMIREPQVDLDAPELIDLLLIDAQTLQLTYNEVLSISSETMAEVTLSPENLAVSSVEVIDAMPNQMIINLQDPLSSGIVYTVCTSEVSDIAGNTSDNECLETFLTIDPAPGDIYVNEILFDPNTGGQDFVEIINVSEKFISLDRVSIRNNQNEVSKTIEGGVTMRPAEILAFTKDPQVQIEMYDPMSPQNILLQELPAFNQDEGNVSLVLLTAGTEIILDSYDYTQDDHFILIDNTKGVSLEKINATTDADTEDAWHSAASDVNHATPGYRNSSTLNIEVQNSDMISLPLKVFSPNEDGMDDLFAIAFNLEQVGYIANVKIFSDRGRLIKNISNNMLLSTESYVYWDGITDEGVLADIGIYIVLVEMFDTDGNIHSMKESFVLADFLD